MSATKADKSKQSTDQLGPLRKQLIELLRGGQAHATFDDAVKDFPANLRGATGSLPHATPLPSTPPPPKNLLEPPRAFIRQHAPKHINPVIQPRQLEHIHNAASSPGTWIPRAKHEPPNPRMHNRRGTHRAHPISIARDLP